MTVERGIRIIAPTFILLSPALGAPASPLFHSAWRRWFTALMGLNPLQSGATVFSPMESLLRKRDLDDGGGP